MSVGDIKTCEFGRAGIDDLTALATGEVQALVLRRFVPAEICTAAVRTLDLVLMGRYRPTSYAVSVQRFGPALKEYRAGGRISADYWHHAQQARLTCRHMRDLQRLRETCLEQLSTACEVECVPATSDGRPLYWGILREINHGTLIRWDDVRREYPGDLLGTRITGQLAFSLLLTAPTSGGETCVWRKQPSADDEQHRLEYGYRARVVDGVAAVRIKPEQGTAVLFNSRNFHQVHPCADNESRLALSFFVGLTEKPDGLLLWS
jgi:L-gamma-glutamyl-L-propargylglycine hydroxylase